MFVLMCNLKYRNIVSDWKDKTLESMNAQSIKSHWDICIQPLFRKTSLSKKTTNLLNETKSLNINRFVVVLKKIHPPSLYIFFTRNKTHTHAHVHKRIHTI